MIVRSAIAPSSNAISMTPNRSVPSSNGSHSRISIVAASRYGE
jgi:hypothetical protein